MLKKQTPNYNNLDIIDTTEEGEHTSKTVGSTKEIERLLGRKSVENNKRSFSYALRA